VFFLSGCDPGRSFADEGSCQNMRAVRSIRFCRFATSWCFPHDVPLFVGRQKSCWRSRT